jgi:putative transposase
MPELLLMKFIPHNLYHVYNQGNNQQIIYYQEKDYVTFLNLTQNLIIPHTEIIAYCLMPNHFHFLICTDGRSNTVIKQGGNYLDAVTNGFRKLLSSYARIINSQNNWTGSLFLQRRLLLLPTASMRRITILIAFITFTRTH